MNDIISYKEVEEKVLTIREQNVLLDSIVAELYGVKTSEINQAVKNNPDKFPEGYIFTLTSEEKNEVVKNFDNLGKIKYSPALPSAFTERGLYMLATILKSPKATQTTIAIVEAFAKMRDLSRAVAQLSTVKEEPQQKALMQRTGEILADILDDDLEVTSDETTIELNLALVKFKRTVKRGKKKE